MNIKSFLSCHLTAVAEIEKACFPNDYWTYDMILSSFNQDNFVIMMYTTYSIFIVCKSIMLPLEQSIIARNTSGNSGEVMGLRQSFVALGQVVGPLIASNMYPLNHYSVFYAEIENEVNGEFVKNLRKKLNMTQNLLASVLGVTKKTIEKWEQGVNPIKGCSARLLYLINKNPAIIKEFYSFEYIPGTPKQFDV